MAKTSKLSKQNTCLSNKDTDNSISKVKTKRKPRDSPPQRRSSIYRGVTRYVYIYIYILIHIFVYDDDKFAVFFFLLGTDGRVDMKLIYGIKIVGTNRRLKKEDKVRVYFYFFLYNIENKKVYLL